MTHCHRLPAIAAAVSTLLLSLACANAQAAPPAAVAQFQTFKIGSYHAVALKDGALEEAVDGKSFVLGQSNEVVGGVLKAAGAPADHFEFSIQPLLVHATDRTLLFDTGAGSFFGAIAGKLQDSLKAAGEDPAAVTDIFISHAHGDHIGGLVTSTGALAFPNAAIHLSLPEWTWLSGLSDDEASANSGIQHVSALVSAIRPKVVPFKPGAVLLPGMVTAVELKGHTPGHSGFRIGSGAQSLLVLGDAMHSYVVSVRRPDWQVAFDGDRPLAAKTRVALVNRAAGDGQRLYAEHFPFPGVGSIVKGKDGASWQPEVLR
jgi:glyoxylase-like metal-dependent hydrolase (beta-lactamase superfamily II)